VQQDHKALQELLEQQVQRVLKEQREMLAQLDQQVAKVQQDLQAVRGLLGQLGLKE